MYSFVFVSVLGFVSVHSLSVLWLSLLGSSVLGFSVLGWSVLGFPTQDHHLHRDADGARALPRVAGEPTALKSDPHAGRLGHDQLLWHATCGPLSLPLE